MIVACGCIWSAEAGQNELMPPSTVSATASALPAPNASSTRWRAFMIVPMPCVMQCVGTWLMSLSKKRALAMRVRSVSVLTRVPEASDEPGSLKPTWPSVPMPRICTSMPPAASIAAS